jgi:hypothetical protein
MKGIILIIEIKELNLSFYVFTYCMNRCPALTSKLITIWVIPRRMKNRYANPPIRIYCKKKQHHSTSSINQSNITNEKKLWCTDKIRYEFIRYNTYQIQPYVMLFLKKYRMLLQYVSSMIHSTFYESITSERKTNHWDAIYLRWISLMVDC